MKHENKNVVVLMPQGNAKQDLIVRVINITTPITPNDVGPVSYLVADMAYKAMNVGVERTCHPEYRSLSVGDVVIIDGEILVCDNCGWVNIPENELQKWLAVPYRDRLMGTQWCRKYNLF